MEKVAPQAGSGAEGETEQQSVRKELVRSEDKGTREGKGASIFKSLGRRGRSSKAESWNRLRTNSEGDIRELIGNKKRGLSSPEDQNKIVKKSAKEEEKMGDRTKEREELEKKYGDMTDRQLMYMMIERMDRMDRREEEREKEKEKVKEEIKQEIRSEIEEEKRKWERKSVELEAKMEAKFKEWEEKARGIGNVAEEKEAGKEREAEMEKMMKVVERRCERLEMEERKKCVVIRGLQKQRRGLEKEMEEFFESKLAVQVKVQQANLIGYEKKLIWVKLSSVEEREKIMEVKKNLGDEPIYIDQDRSKEERALQREIVKEAKKLREENHNVKIGFKKVEVDGTTYRWSEKERTMKKERKEQFGYNWGKKDKGKKTTQDPEK